MRSWTLRSDFYGDYIFPICLPEEALTSPISLCFLGGNGFKTIPDCIYHMSGLSKLEVSGCRDLVALPQLPDVNDQLVAVTCRVRGKQNGVTVVRGSTKVHMPDLYGRREHLYIFEESFSLNQDSPEAEETTFSKLTFVFIVHDEAWKVKGCGVRLLEEVPRCIPDGKETQDEECMGVSIEENNENAGGEDEENEDDNNDDDNEEDE
ncbi:unnamed protein product, partial [Brassica oleracea]